jgi:hypothetical protein
LEENEDYIGAGNPPVFSERDNGEEKFADEEEVGDVDQEEDLVDLFQALTSKH